MSNQGQSLEDYIKNQNDGSNQRGGFQKRGGYQGNRGRFQNQRNSGIMPRRFINGNQKVNNNYRGYKNYQLVSKRYDNNQQQNVIKRPRKRTVLITKRFDGNLRNMKYSGNSKYQLNKKNIVPTLKITGVNYNIQNHQINELFSTVGQLVKCKIEYDNLGNSTGVAYVKYKTLEDTEASIQKFNKSQIDNRTVTVTKKYANLNKFSQNKNIPGVKRRNYFKTIRYDNDQFSNRRQRKGNNNRQPR